MPHLRCGLPHARQRPSVHAIVYAALCASLLTGFLSGCDSPATATTTTTLRIKHDTRAVPALEAGQAHYSTFSGTDATGEKVYGPVTQPFASEHVLADVPTTVTQLHVDHRHASGQRLGEARVAVQEVSPGAPLTAVAAPPPNAVAVEIVNDTGNTGGDASMYLMFDTPKTPAAGAVSGITLLGNSGDSNANGQSAALNSLPAIGTTVSPYTGATRTVYGFTVNSVDSGRFTFSYGSPMAIVKGASPTATSPVRYDKMEITFKDGAGGGNLTAIDFHGIPLKVEVTHAGDDSPDPLQTKSFHASMPTLLGMLSAMGAPRGVDMTSAFIDTTGTGKFAYKPGGTDFSGFTRILSPNTLAAMPGKGGSPAPYPSFSSYLHSLVGKTYRVNGTQYGGYGYNATFSSDGAGGYRVVCTGTVNTAQALPAKSTAPPLPGPAANATVTINLPAGQMDFFTYATVVNQSSYSIAGYPFAAGVSTLPGTTTTATYSIQDTVNAANASAYGALVGDIQAALNFGYLGGRFDAGTITPGAVQDISTYYASVMLPYAYPYGGARVSNDGFYNPYAGLFYYTSDAYGHPFSDRVAAASPLYALRPGDTVRITILNDNRLDTPLASVTSAGTDTLTVSWPTVSGATGYTVATSPAGTGTPCTPATSGGQQACTITGLSQGTSYLVSVTANATSAGGAAISSGVLPIQGLTAGSGPGRGSGPYNIQVGVNLPNAPVIPGMQAYVNGQLASGGISQATVNAVSGQNVMGMQILDASDHVAWSGSYFVTVTPSGTAAFNVSQIKLQYGMTALTAAGPPSTPPYPNSGGLVIGTPFTPKPYYQYFPVVLP